MMNTIIAIGLSIMLFTIFIGVVAAIWCRISDSGKELSDIDESDFHGTETGYQHDKMPL